MTLESSLMDPRKGSDVRGPPIEKVLRIEPPFDPQHRSAKPSRRTRREVPTSSDLQPWRFAGRGGGIYTTQKIEAPLICPRRGGVSPGSPQFGQEVMIWIPNRGP